MGLMMPDYTTQPPVGDDVDADVARSLFRHVADKNKFVVRCTFEDESDFYLTMRDGKLCILHPKLVSPLFREWVIVRLKIDHEEYINPPECVTGLTYTQCLSRDKYHHLVFAYSGALHAFIISKLNSA